MATHLYYLKIKVIVQIEVKVKLNFCDILFAHLIVNYLYFFPVKN